MLKNSFLFLKKKKKKNLSNNITGSQHFLSWFISQCSVSKVLDKSYPRAWDWRPLCSAELWPHLSSIF